MRDSQGLEVFYIVRVGDQKKTGRSLELVGHVITRRTSFVTGGRGDLADDRRLKLTEPIVQLEDLPLQRLLNRLLTPRLLFQHLRTERPFVCDSLLFLVFCAQRVLRDAK